MGQLDDIKQEIIRLRDKYHELPNMVQSLFGVLEVKIDKLLNNYVQLEIKIALIEERLKHSKEYDARSFKIRLVILGALLGYVSLVYQSIRDFLLGK